MGIPRYHQNRSIVQKIYQEFIVVNLNCPNVMVYRETGTHSVELHVVSRMVSFYMRIINGKQNKLSVIMLNLIRKKMEADVNFESG